MGRVFIHVVSFIEKCIADACKVVVHVRLVVWK